MRRAWVDVEGTRIHYLDHGGEGPTLIMTHGLTANARFFDGLAARLSPNTRLVSVDLRGRGLSDEPDGGYALDDHAGDVLGLLDHLGIEKANIGGHSYGGLLTYHMAAHHPERVERCVVIDTPVEVDESILMQIKPSLDRLGQVQPSWEAYIAAVKSQPFFDDWWEPRVEDYYRADVLTNPDGSVQSRSHPDHIRQAAEGTIGMPWERYRREIDAPILLIRATRRFGPPGAPPLLGAEDARAAIAEMRYGRLAEIDGNHYSLLFGERAIETARVIEEFLCEGVE